MSLTPLGVHYQTEIALILAKDQPIFLQLNELSVPSTYTAEQRDKLCWRNAAQLYGIQSPALSASAAAQ